MGDWYCRRDCFSFNSFLRFPNYDCFGQSRKASRRPRAFNRRHLRPYPYNFLGLFVKINRGGDFQATRVLRLTQMLKLKTQNHNLNLKSDLRYRTYQFSLSIIKLVSTFPEGRVFWIIGDQLLRAATSIGANLIEAKSSSSKRDFIRFYEIALKSANETRYWLLLLRDSRLIKELVINPLLNEAEEIAKMIGSSLLTMKGKR